MSGAMGAVMPFVGRRVLGVAIGLWLTVAAAAAPAGEAAPSVATPVPAAAAQKPPAAAIATAHPLATKAGEDILAKGGNAFDAAVAVTAALAVVEPMSSGLGGGGFWLLHRARDGKDVMLDGRERAPLAASATMYQDDQGHVVPSRSIDGPLAAGIPGTPAAIVYLARHYGRLPLATDLAPAIRYARDGFPADDHYVRLARFRLPLLRRYPDTAATFLRDGQVPLPQTVIRQPELADTLQAIAKEGRKAFYTGTIARRLVDGVRAAGGIWTLRDLAQYRLAEREPLVGTYRGIRIISAPPPSSGGVALITMLNILAGYDLDGLPAVTRKHLIIEAMRRAYRDRAQYLGDPDFVDVPVAMLTSPYYAAGLRNAIRPDRATPSSMLAPVTDHPDGTNTTHFSVLDRDGNRVSATMSINYPFGSGFVPPGTGILLNDEMDDFSSKPGVPNVYGLVGGRANAIAPGKRPLSSMTPTFLVGKPGVGIVGTPGGSRIITMVLLATLDYAQGHAPDSWVSLPRYHHQYLPDEVQFEAGAFTAEEQKQLAAMGHTLKPLQRCYGNMQAILWDTAGDKVLAASDPCGNGAAVVLKLKPKTAAAP